MEATQEFPGSEGKVAVLSARLEAYGTQERCLHHPDDDRTPTSPPSSELGGRQQDQEYDTLTPQQNLAAAVLREAVEAILQFRVAKEMRRESTTVRQVYDLKVARLDAIQAMNWLFSDDPALTTRFSLSDVCELFGADIDAMRQQICVKLGGNLEDGELLL
jgi:hypothetical protein